MYMIFLSLSLTHTYTHTHTCHSHMMVPLLPAIVCSLHSATRCNTLQHTETPIVTSCSRLHAHTHTYTHAPQPCAHSTTHACFLAQHQGL